MMRKFKHGTTSAMKSYGEQMLRFLFEKSKLVQEEEHHAIKPFCHGELVRKELRLLKTGDQLKDLRDGNPLGAAWSPQVSL